MYGLKQTSVLAYKNLSKFLTVADYTPIIGTSGLWCHKTKSTIFCLCVNDFGIKYYNIENIYYLKNTIESQYICKIDWENKYFLGFTLD